MSILAKSKPIVTEVEQLTNTVTDMRQAYRVLLDNVNKLQKSIEDKISYQLWKEVSDQADYIENDQKRIESNLNRIHEDLNHKIKQLENKLLDDHVTEYTSTHPGQIYLEAKEKLAAAKMDLLNTDIAHLEWSVRAINCLQHILQIQTLADLISYSEKSLMKTRNLGQRTLNEIKTMLDKYDLALREDDDHLWVEADHLWKEAD